MSPTTTSSSSTKLSQKQLRDQFFGKDMAPTVPARGGDDSSGGESSLIWQRAPLGGGDVRRKREAFEQEIQKQRTPTSPREEEKAVGVAGQQQDGTVPNGAKNRMNGKGCVNRSHSCMCVCVVIQLYPTPNHRFN